MRYLLFLQFNFVGKLLGPKGNSLKRLQEDTMCKMAVLGRGSMKDRHKVNFPDFPLLFSTIRFKAELTLILIKSRIVFKENMIVQSDVVVLLPQLIISRITIHKFSREQNISNKQHNGNWALVEQFILSTVTLNQFFQYTIKLAMNVRAENGLWTQKANKLQFNTFFSRFR